MGQVSEPAAATSYCQSALGRRSPGLRCKSCFTGMSYSSVLRAIVSSWIPARVPQPYLHGLLCMSSLHPPQSLSQAFGAVKT